MSIASFISGDVGPGVTIPLLITRGLSIGEAVVVEATPETYTGGFATAWSRHKDAEEVRRERIALGIIPDDAPAEIIKEAASQKVEVLAKRRLRELARESDQLDRLEAITLELMAAQREAEEQAYRQLLADLQESEAAYSLMHRNENARAVLVMLGML